MSQKVAFFGPIYGIGGAGHVCSDVGKELARRGYDVDFLVDGRYRDGGYLQEDFPSSASVVHFTGASSDPHSRHNLAYYWGLLRGLVQYMRSQEALTLFSNATKYNILAVWASAVAKSRLVLVEHNTLRPRVSGARRVLPSLVRSHYPFADSVVGVSSDIVSEFAWKYGLGRDFCTMIENPVDVDRITEMAEEEVGHEWFSGDTPVIVGVGRFVGLKQFSVLLSAFQRLRSDARLVMIGEGPLEEKLQEHASRLGIEEDVHFLGFTDNPYKYMRRADLLAHSSRYEGFGLVLVEALACGTPVVATDCPGGPSDILADGEYGELVEVGDAQGLARAIESTLQSSPDTDRLVQRAQEYDVETIAEQYEKLIR